MQATKFRPAPVSAFERFNMPSTCGCCGRQGLKKTVKVTNGETTMFMGTGCALKACRMSDKAWQKAQAELEAKKYNRFLDIVCPEFTGQWIKQMALVGVGHTRRTDVYEKTGTVVAMDSIEGRDSLARLTDALVNGVSLGYGKGQACFTTEETQIAFKYVRTSFMAWKGVCPDFIGTDAWLEAAKAI